MIVLLEKLTLKEETKEFGLSLRRLIFAELMFLIRFSSDTAATWIVSSLKHNLVHILN